jgi:hypothetical protein
LLTAAPSRIVAARESSPRILRRRRGGTGGPLSVGGLATGASPRRSRSSTSIASGTWSALRQREAEPEVRLAAPLTAQRQALETRTGRRLRALQDQDPLFAAESLRFAPSPRRRRTRPQRHRPPPRPRPPPGARHRPSHLHRHNNGAGADPDTRRVRPRVSLPGVRATGVEKREST